MPFVVEGGVESLFCKGELDLAESVLELVEAVLLLLGHGVLGVHELVGLPVEDPVDLVEGDDEGDLLGAEELHGLDGLVLEPVHEVDDQDGEVAEGGAAGPEVGEGLVAGRVDDQEAGDLQVQVDLALALVQVAPQVVLREPGRADLLRDAARLAALHVGSSQLVQDLGLARVHVAHDAQDGQAQVRLLLRLLLGRHQLLPPLLLPSFPLLCRLCVVLHLENACLFLLGLLLPSLFALLLRLLNCSLLLLIRVLQHSVFFLRCVHHS